ncbi:hypothetical protein RIEGSTA812A_PEG_405 [invertebrate metagenome]|uniref:Uncharacterized protein n=1 Tax=invertebrate metagenome TaxID=1711999 RepID=A0A484HAX4_9ZZZZ
MNSRLEVPQEVTIRLSQGKPSPPLIHTDHSILYIHPQT